MRLVGPAASRRDGRALVVLRPEQFDLFEASDGPANPGAWRVRGRRFARSEILIELVAPDGFTIGSEAGPHVRRLRIGDAVVPRLREVETVAFPASPDDASAQAHDRAPTHDRAPGAQTSAETAR